MTEPYLILHKVRGEPAFDIAERWTFDGEEGWIIPTSGHRAYPVTAHRLDLIIKQCSIGIAGVDSLPDHYASNDRPICEATYNVQARAARLLAKLGLVSKIERRD